MDAINRLIQLNKTKTLNALLEHFNAENKIKEESELSDGSEDEDDDDDDDDGFDDHDNCHHDHCEELTDTPLEDKSKKIHEGEQAPGEKGAAGKGFWMSWFKGLVDRYLNLFLL